MIGQKPVKNNQNHHFCPNSRAFCCKIMKFQSPKWKSSKKSPKIEKSKISAASGRCIPRYQQNCYQKCNWYSAARSGGLMQLLVFFPMTLYSYSTRFYRILKIFENWWKSCDEKLGGRGENQWESLLNSLRFHDFSTVYGSYGSLECSDGLHTLCTCSIHEFYRLWQFEDHRMRFDPKNMDFELGGNCWQNCAWSSKSSPKPELQARFCQQLSP